MNDLKTKPSEVQMQIVVRDKDGNIKYQGPLNMKIERKEDGGNALDSGS